MTDYLMQSFEKRPDFPVSLRKYLEARGAQVEFTLHPEAGDTETLDVSAPSTLTLLPPSPVSESFNQTREYEVASR